MAADILNELDASLLGVFKKDFIQIIKVSVELDRYYSSGHQSLDSMLPRFEKLIAEFNNKYHGLRLRLKKSVENLLLRIFAKEVSVKDFFANSASKISGVKSIGRTNFNQADVNDMERFAQLLDSLQDRVYIAYSDAESGTSSLSATFDRKENMVEIAAESSILSNENSAAFKICAYYATKNETHMNIEIYSQASTFGFSNPLNEIEKREWHDKFRGR